jgi:hypothetical protein
VARITEHEPDSHSGGSPAPTPAEGSGHNPEGRRHVSSPRQLLVGCSVAMFVVAWYTHQLPDRFLAWTGLWTVLAVVAGVACLAAAVRPCRALTSLSGATLITVSLGRAAALAVAWHHEPRDPWDAEYAVSIAKWLVIAWLTYIVWREYVMPWSIAWSRQHNGTVK